MNKLQRIIRKIVLAAIGGPFHPMPILVLEGDFSEEEVNEYSKKARRMGYWLITAEKQSQVSIRSVQHDAIRQWLDSPEGKKCMENSIGAIGIDSIYFR